MDRVTPEDRAAILALEACSRPLPMRARYLDAMRWQADGCASLVASLAEENNELRVRLRAVIGPPLEALKLHLDPKDHGIRFRSHLVKMFLWEMAKILDAEPAAKNCIQMRIGNGHASDGRAFSVTLQREGGKTPMELRAETEAENERLRARVAELEGVPHA